jgi:hypothetical protein
MLSVIFWNGGSGDWSNAANWKGGVVPGPTDTAVILDSNITVTHDSGQSDSAHEVDFQGTGSLLSITDGQLHVVGSYLRAQGNDFEQSGGSFSGAVQVDSLALSGGTCSALGGFVGSLTFSGGTFALNGNLLVTGPMSWTAGSIMRQGLSGQGNLTARGGLTLGGTKLNTSYLLTLGADVTLVNQGQAVMQQSTGTSGNFSTQLILSSVSPFGGESPATFDNKGVFDLQGDNTIINGDNPGPFPAITGIYLNENRVTKSAGTSAVFPSAINVTFENGDPANPISGGFGGVIELDTGTLWLQDGGSFSATPEANGTLSVNQGASIEFRAGTFDVTGALTNVPLLTPGISGEIDFSGATVNFTGTNAVYSQYGDTVISAGSFNYGVPTTAQMGNLTISGDGTLVVMGAGSTLDLSRFFGGTLTQTAGELDLDGGTINAPNGYNLSAGTFSGSGTIHGPVTNAGTFYPGGNGAVGVLKIGDSSYGLGTGSFTQTATGHLVLDIGGTTPGTQYDQLLLDQTFGVMRLSGSVELNTIDGFSPAVGDSFTLVKGVMAYQPDLFFLFPPLDSGKFLQANYGRSDLTFSVILLNGIAVDLTPSNASPSYGQSESFTTLVTPTQGGVFATGTVSFFVDGTPLGAAVTLKPAPFEKATATSITTTTITAGPHTIRADYSGDGTYPATSTSVTLTVAKAHLGVVADNKTRPAGQANPPLTASFVGFVNGEDATSAHITGSPTLKTTATTTSPAAIYPITVGDAGTLAAPNYDFPASGFVNGTLTVIPATSANVIAGSTLPSSTYGQSVRFTATVSGGGPVPTGTVQFLVDGANFGGLVTLVKGLASSTPTTTLGAGSHSIVARYSGDPNYGGNTGTVSQQVAKASLTVIADDKSMTRFAGLRPLTFSLTGFVNGENATSAGVVVAAKPVTTGTPASRVGYYPIFPNVSSLTAANYQLGGVRDGTLTIKPSVTNVLVEFGNNQTMSISGLSRDLPFLNIRAIDVVFSDNVNLGGASLQLIGVNVPNYQVGAAIYNPTTMTARWTLPSALGADRLTLNLGGVVAPPNAGSGPNIAADPFHTSFAVLPGDVNGDGVVTIADAIGVRDHLQSYGGAYLIWADVDGNGVVDLTDMTAVRNRMGLHLP